MFDRFAQPARTAITLGADEAARRGDRRLGTDHLLLGLLHDPEMAATLRIDVQRARDESQVLDRRALAEIGFDVGDFAPPQTTAKAAHTPLSSGVRSVLPRALTLAGVEKSRRITARHVLLALLERERPDPAAVLLDSLKIDRAEVRARLTASHAAATR